MGGSSLWGMIVLSLKWVVIIFTVMTSGATTEWHYQTWQAVLWCSRREDSVWRGNHSGRWCNGSLYRLFLPQNGTLYLIAISYALWAVKFLRGNAPHLNIGPLTTLHCVILDSAFFLAYHAEVQQNDKDVLSISPEWDFLPHRGPTNCSVPWHLCHRHKCSWEVWSNCKCLGGQFWK